MKTAEVDIELNIHPEVLEKNLANQELLEYLADRHPAIEKIRILEVNEINENRILYKMKYIVVTPVPKALKKLMKSQSQEITSGMTIIMDVNKQSYTTAVTVIPEMMSDKVNSTCLSTVTRDKGRWIMHIQITVDIKVFGIGGAIEKHSIDVSKELMVEQYRLIDEFLSRN